MTAQAIRLLLDAPNGHYRPGERLTGRYMVDAQRPNLAWYPLARSIELSVLWYTAGKGEEDMAVHHFERLVEDLPRQALDLRVPRRFATVLPSSPLSYDGYIVKVCWCVRLRLFFPQGQEALAETPFCLGSVPPAGAGDRSIENEPSRSE